MPKVLGECSICQSFENCFVTECNHNYCEDCLVQDIILKSADSLKLQSLTCVHNPNSSRKILHLCKN